MKLEDIINVTVRKAIKDLKREGLIKSNHTTSFKKTEKLLYEFNKLSPETEYGRNKIDRVKEALKSIENDPYYDLIELRYFKGYTYEKLCEYYGVESSSIKYHKNRLINKIKAFLFPDDVIREITESFIDTV